MAKQEIPVGSIWRRKSNGNLVRITKAESQGTLGSVVKFEAVNRKWRQPETGRKYAHYFFEEFELSTTPAPDAHGTIEI